MEKNESFDETYEKQREMFGHPYKELQVFFKNYPIKGTVLDLGCGQGRDSLFLASLGYQVTAVDLSQVGIDQMLEKAKKLKLNINGIQADIFNLKIESRFDVILFDMVLHGLTETQQSTILEKYSKMLHDQGIICIVYPDDVDKSQFIEKLNDFSGNWNFLEEIDVKDVPQIDGEIIDFTFKMLVAKYSS